jgi:hypothetical protein
VVLIDVVGIIQSIEGLDRKIERREGKFSFLSSFSFL